MKTLIVLPTFNEKDNIGTLIGQLIQHPMKPDILVVDDSSPDGTAQIVNALHFPQVFLIQRMGGKGGRGGAVREGLLWGQSRGYNLIIEMDSDLSHNPNELETFKNNMEAFLDSNQPVMTIASRYLRGSSITGWPLSRRMLSRLSNKWVRHLLKLKISDFTNGYRAYNRAAVDEILKNPQQNTGFIYLSEILFLITKGGGKIMEFPSHWSNRVRGQSSVGFKEISQAFRGALKLSQQSVGRKD